MLKRIIETSSRKGDLVLDGFAGSGTTLVAAEELGRQWIGIDIGDEAIATIINRFKNGSKPMGDYVKKKAQPQAMTISLFGEERMEQEEHVASKEFSSPVSFDLFDES